MSGEFLQDGHCFEYLENLPEALGVRLVQIVFLFFALSHTQFVCFSLFLSLSLLLSLCLCVSVSGSPCCSKSHRYRCSFSVPKENCRPPQQQNN